MGKETNFHNQTSNIQNQNIGSHVQHHKETVIAFQETKLKIKRAMDDII